eukprot:scaffold15185_cov107-Isochrysis_galbana.AAC.1
MSAPPTCERVLQAAQLFRATPQPVPEASAAIAAGAAPAQNSAHRWRRATGAPRHSWLSAGAVPSSVTAPGTISNSAIASAAAGTDSPAVAAVSVSGPGAPASPRSATAPTGAWPSAGGVRPSAGSIPLSSCRAPSVTCTPSPSPHESRERARWAVQASEATASAERRSASAVSLVESVKKEPALATSRALAALPAGRSVHTEPAGSFAGAATMAGRVCPGTARAAETKAWKEDGSVGAPGA